MQGYSSIRTETSYLICPENELSGFCNENSGLQRGKVWKPIFLKELKAPN